MRECALHGGPASNGREGTSLILAGYWDFCPGDTSHSPSSVGIECGVQTQWQRRGIGLGPRALVVAPAALVLFGYSLCLRSC